jgi:hypothetical protein
MRTRVCRCSRRRGFVLITVLWIVVALSATAMGVALLARHGVATARNRLELLRARWRAEDCLARAQVAIEDAAAANVTDPLQPATWTRLNRIVEASPVVTAIPCTVWLRDRRRALSADSLGVAGPDTLEEAAPVPTIGAPAPEPGGWVLTVRATSGDAPVLAAAIEVHLVRAGERAAIVRQRTWP